MNTDVTVNTRLMLVGWPNELSAWLPFWEIGDSSLMGSNPGWVKPMTYKLIPSLTLRIMRIGQGTVE